MALLETGNARGGGTTLTADATDFAASAGAGTLIANLSKPFGTGTTYQAVGTVPPQVALASGGRIVAGVGAAGGTSYAIKIRANSADTAREVAETLSFTGTGTGVAATLASASSKLRIPFALTDTSANNYQDSRIWDVAQAASDQIMPVFCAESMSSSAGTVLRPNPITYWYSVLTGSVDRALNDNQSAATQSFATFANAQADATFTGPDGTAWSYVWRIDTGVYQPATYAALVAAGGGVDTTSSATYQGARVPGGWLVIGDPIPVSLAAGQFYAHQCKAVAPASTTGGLIDTCYGGNRIKYAASFATGLFASKNWTGGSGLSSNTGACGPVAVIGRSLAGKRTAMICGDSIWAGDPGDGLGGPGSPSLNVPGIGPRALALGGVASFRAAVPSTSADKWNAQPVPLYAWLLRFCGALVHNHSHNGGTIADHQAFHNFARARMLPGSLIGRATPTPTQTGGASTGAGYAISAITSASTTATVTTTSAGVSALSVGSNVQIGLCDVTGYAGVVQVVAKPSSTTFTYTLPGGGSDLAAATTARMATGTDNGPAVAMKSYIEGSGLTVGAGSGGHDFAIDTDGAVGTIKTSGNRWWWARLEDSLEGTHPLGANTVAPTGTLAASAAAYLATPIKTALGSGF